MLKKIIASAFVVALSGASIMQPAHAGAILIKDFYANLDNGSQQLIGSVKVDIDDGQQWIDNIYQAFTWSSFTLFGKEVDIAYDFIAEFNIDDLQAGFTFLQFDVQDLLNDVTFKGFFSDTDGIAAADLYNTTTNDELFANGVSVTDTRVVSAPATAALFLMGFAGLMLRRRAQQ